jgi:hypothetical protein
MKYKRKYQFKIRYIKIVSDLQGKREKNTRFLKNQFLPDMSLSTILDFVSKISKVILVLKVVTFRVIIGMIAGIVGDEVGAAVGWLIVITRKASFTAIVAVLALLKDVDNLLTAVRNDPVGPIAVVSPVFNVE